MNILRQYKQFFKAALAGLCLVAVFFLFAGDVMAQADVFGVQPIQENTQLGSDDIRVTVAKIINVFLILLGTIAFGLVVYGGFVYMTSGGSEEKVAQAKKILVNATIGLAIVLSAFAITQFVLNKLQQAIIDGPAGEDDGNVPAGDCVNIGNCPIGGGAPDAQCLRENNLFVVQSLSPNTSPVDGDTGMTNVTIRAVFSQQVHQNVDTNTLFHVQRVGDDNDIDEAAVRVIENGYVAEAEFAVITDNCIIADGVSDSCLGNGDYTIEVDAGITDKANRVLEVDTDCGVFPRQTGFTNNVDALDVNPPVVDVVSIDGKREDVVGDDNIILRRGFVYAIESDISDRVADQGGLSYVDLHVERVRPGGNGPIDIFDYQDGPRVPAGSHGPYEFLYRLPLGSLLDVPAKYGVSVSAHDIDGHVTTQNTDFVVVGENCLNNRQDDGEVGIDIGGECLGMGQCIEDWQCASNKCGADGQCVAWPEIQGIIPGTWDGAEGNYVTIVGRFFGAQVGTVEFGFDRDGNGEIGNEANEWVAAQAPLACQARNVPVWTDSWVIVEVPDNADLPIGSESAIRITKNVVLPAGEPLFQDTSIDAHGPKPGPNLGLFTKNEIKRPGICSLEDLQNNVITEGIIGDTVVAHGSGFGPIQNGKISFANVDGDIDLWDDIRAQTKVPALQPTALFVSVTSNNEQSNGIGFKVIAEENGDNQPFIESIDPTTTTPGSLVTLFGRNFGDRGFVFLADSPEAAAACRPGGACIELSIDLPGNCGVTWEDDTIIVQIPLGGVPPGGYFMALRSGDASSAGDTQIDIQAGNPKPGVCRIEPKNGPAPRPDGEPLQLTGINFSNAPTVYFSQRDFDPANLATWLWSGPGDNADLIRGNAVIQARNNEEISTLIPENQDGFSMNIGRGRIKVATNVNELSNAAQYTVNDCRVDDAPPGDPAQYRCCEEGSGAGLWVRNGQACPGETRDAGYVWRFTTGKIPNVPQVLEQCNEVDWANPDIAEVPVPSPAPWRNRQQGEQACLNASIVVGFSTGMNVATLGNDNVKLFLCEDLNGEPNCAADARQEVPNVDLDLQYENGSLWIKRGGLAQNQWYHIELSDRIESLENIVVAGVNRAESYPLAITRPCGPGTAYCFDFKTGNGVCQLTAASVNPPQKTTGYLGVIQDPRYPFDQQHIEAPIHPFYFYVWGRGNQVCQPLDVDGIGWEWGSDDPRVEAMVAVNEDYIDSRATVRATANTAPESAEVRAVLDDQDDFGPMDATSDVTVDLGDPTVVRYWPNCAESCTNAVVGMEFSRMMRFNTYRGGFTVQKCADEFCRQLLPGAIQLEDVEADSPYRYRVRPNPALEEGAWYLAQATDQIISVGSIDPLRDGPPLVEFSWKFRTKQQDGFCQIESVRLEPDPFTAQVIGEKTKYLSIPYSSPDACSPLGQELNPWGYGWDWASTQEPVAEVSDFTYYGESKPYCTTSCLPRGSSIARDSYVTIPPVCGDGVIGPGEDCDIAINGEVAGTSCTLSCLRPGNAVVGDDANANQCGNGVVNQFAGEECDPAHPVHGQFCRANCTWQGSSSQQPLGAEERAWCGSGGVPTDGEDCDVNISIAQAGANPQYSAIGCSSQCLHLGTPLSQLWCAAHRGDSPEARQACDRAVSVCGNAQLELGEECEVVNNNLLVNGRADELDVPGDGSTYCTNTCLLTNICGVQGLPAAANGGVQCDPDEPYCSAECKILGSSVYYDNPSMCGDAEGEVGEYLGCELTQDEARAIDGGRRQNPIQMVTAQGLGDVVDGRQETDIRASAVTGPEQTDNGIIVAPINPPVVGIGDYTLQCGFTEIDAQQKLIAEEAILQRVVDGTMEAQNVNAWRVYVNNVDVKEKSRDVFVEGRQSLHLQRGAGFPGFVRQSEIAVESGKKYHISLKYRLDAGSFAVSVGPSGAVFRDFDGENHLDGGDVLGNPDATEWREYIRDFSIPNGVSEIDLLFRVTGNVYIDDVRMEQVIDSPVISNDCPQNADGSFGVGTNSCCYPRPARTAEYPEHGSAGVCRNSVISFSIFHERPIEEASLVGNIILAEGHEQEEGQDLRCPIGQVDITGRVNSALAFQGNILNQEGGFFRNIWNRVKHFFAGIFAPQANAAVPPVQHQAIRLWCAGDISVDGTVAYEWNEDETMVTSTVQVAINRALTPSAVYAVLLSGGVQGIKDDLGVSIRSQHPADPNVNPGANNEYLHTDYFTFETGEEICKLKSVMVDPPQKLFTVPEEEENFHAQTQSLNGQQIQSIPLVYAWEWFWGPQQNDIFAIPVPPAATNTADTVIGATNVEGALPAVAQAIVTADADQNQHVGRIFSGITQLTAKFCENPWPSRDVFPYVDEDFNFSMEYCADAGVSGTTLDDLPFFEPTLGDIEDQQGLVSEDTLKRTLFVNRINDDVIGVQVLQNTNPERLSASAWFEQKFPFGDVQVVSVAGYDAVTDGSNYYINALNQEGPPGNRDVYNNIYVFSINDTAQADTRNVFEQLLASLTFNTNLTDYGYCLHEGIDNDTPAHERKIPIDENDLRSFAEVGTRCQTDFDCKQSTGEPLAGTNGICSNAKTKFLRDWNRLGQIKVAQEKIQTYRDDINNARYPELAGGTYIPQYTNSRWPSWGLLGGFVGGLPIDPINQWSDCQVCEPREIEEEGDIVIREVCEQKDPQTCWDQGQSTLYCPLAMSVMEYEAIGTTDYVLHAPLEYFSQEEGLIQEFVTTTHFTTERWCQPLAQHNPFGGRCGDGVINAADGEECDPPGSAQSGFNHRIVDGARIQCPIDTAASRSCTNTCTWEYGQCQLANICGDGIIQAGEVCDDGDLNGRYGHCDAPGQVHPNAPGCRSVGAAGFCGNGVQDIPQEFCEHIEYNGRPDKFQVLWKGAGDNRARVYYGADIFHEDCLERNLHFGLCDLVETEMFRGKHCQRDTSLLCSDNDDCLAPDRSAGIYNIYNRGERVANNFSDELNNYGPCVPTNGRFGAEYNFFEELSCSLDCQTVGGFCGDGIRQGAEQCDDGNDNEEDGCDTSCRGVAEVAVEEVPAAGSCGDGVVQTPNNEDPSINEACDLGDQNGIACEPEYGKSCTYCAANCSEVLQVDATAYCGNGVIDRVGDIRLGDVFGQNDPALNQIVADFERCDVVPGTETVIASTLYDEIDVPPDQPGLLLVEMLARGIVLGADLSSLPHEEKICLPNEGYVAKGTVTCDNECRVLNTSGCVNCGLYENAGKAVPKLAVLNVLTPRVPSEEWANQSENLRQRRLENGRYVTNPDGTFVEGEPINGVANHTRLTLNAARDSWRWYSAIAGRNSDSAFICLQQKWGSALPHVESTNTRGCGGNARFTDIECKRKHVRYVAAWNYTNYMSPQWLCADGSYAPLDRGYGYEVISDATIASEDPTDWEWVNYTEKARQIESNPLCTEEYSVYFGSRGIQSEKAQQFWAARREDTGDLYDQFGDFFPYPVDGEPAVVQNSIIVSPAVPPNHMRVVVRSKPVDDDGAFGFVGNVYSRKYSNPLTNRTGGRLSYTDIIAEDSICFLIEKGGAGVWSGYWQPRLHAHCSSYNNTTMNLLGTVRGISAQATTVDVNIPGGPGNDGTPFAFFVSAVTNDANVPISAFRDREVQVEVYQYHEGQVPSYSVYKPTHVFEMNRAEGSGNAGLARYWHVFNIVRVNGTYEIRTASQNPAAVGRGNDGIARENGSIETGFVDVLCNVPGEPCNRE